MTLMENHAAVREASGSYFIIQLQNYAIDTVLLDNAANLVVTFEPMDRWKTLGPHRKGWGIDFLQDLGCSVMAVMCQQNDWYRKPDLLDFFIQMNKSGFFHGFEQVMTYGGSMGGYGALAYADAVNADVVLSINPQATLSERLAPWETRFSQGKKQHWEGPFANAADGFRKVSAAYVAYDPFLPLDVRQVKLLKIGNPQLVELKIPVVGHHLPKWMMEMDILKSTVQAIVTGQFSEKCFYQAARKRRLIKRYWKMLVTKPRVLKSPLFTGIVLRYAEHYGFSLSGKTFKPSESPPNAGLTVSRDAGPGNERR